MIVNYILGIDGRFFFCRPCIWLMSFASSQKPHIRICSRVNPAASRALSQSPKAKRPHYKDVVVLQISSKDLSVLFLGLLNSSDPLPLAMRIVVTAGTMIYAKCFGAELVRAEPVIQHVGFTISAVND
jgi:hypothetical protein